MKENMKNMLEFDWTEKNVWEEYKEDLQRFFDLLTEYRKAKNDMRKYVGKPLLRVVGNKDKKDLEEVFVGGIESEKGYSRFIAEAYGIGVDPEEFLNELNSPKESKSPKDFKEKLYEKINIKKFDRGFSSAIDEIYEDLINAGFKSNAKFRGDYKGVVEDIIKMFIHLSPLSNPKSFFINSLRHTPKFYVEKMYSNTEFIENYFRWSKWTNWKDLEDEYNLWNFEPDGEWYHIGEALDKMYGPRNFLDINFQGGLSQPGAVIGKFAEEFAGIEESIERYYNIHIKNLQYGPIWADFIEKVELRDEWYMIDLKGKFKLKDLQIKDDRYITNAIAKDVDGKLMIKYISPHMFLNLTKVYFIEATGFDRQTYPIRDYFIYIHVA